MVCARGQLGKENKDGLGVPGGKVGEAAALTGLDETEGTNQVEVASEDEWGKCAGNYRSQNN